MRDMYEDAGEFTTNMLNKFWDINYEDSENYNDVLKFLNQAENFRTFNDGLTEFIKKHGYVEEDGLNEKTYIKKRTDFLYNKFKEQNISISKATLENYFSGETRPVTKKANRTNVFKLCFAMGLNLEETNDFFTKIYLDRTFNVKNVHELVYYFCIKNNKNYTYATDLIEKSEELLNNNSSKNTDSQVYTSSIREETDFFTTEEELMRYIENNKDSFNRYNVTAVEQFNKLLNRIQGSKEDRDFINKLKKGKRYKNITSEDEQHLKHCGLVIQDAIKQNIIFDTDTISEYTANKDVSSIDFMLFVIYNSPLPIGIEKTYSFANNAHLLKLIKSNFPSKHIFSKIKKDPLFSFEALRKAIILLVFYEFCFDAEQYCESDGKYFDEFIEQMDDILTSCGMGPLYIGNPYDWLFLFCIKSNQPLNTFRGIIDEACILEENFNI